MDFHFLDCKKMIIVRIIEVDNTGIDGWRAFAGADICNLDALAYHLEFILIDVKKRVRCRIGHELHHSLCNLTICNPRIESAQSLFKITGEDYISIWCASKRTIKTENFLIICEHDIPAEFIVQEIPGTLLNEYVFWIVVCHNYASILMSPDMRRGRISSFAERQFSWSVFRMLTCPKYSSTICPKFLIKSFLGKTNSTFSNIAFVNCGCAEPPTIRVNWSCFRQKNIYDRGISLYSSWHDTINELFVTKHSLWYVLWIFPEPFPLLVIRTR